MNRKKPFVVVALGLAFGTLAVSSCTNDRARSLPTARSFPPPQLTPAQTQADFDAMRKALAEALWSAPHVNSSRG